MGFCYTPPCMHKSNWGNASFTFWLPKKKFCLLSVIITVDICCMYLAYFLLYNDVSNEAQFCASVKYFSVCVELVCAVK